MLERYDRTESPANTEVLVRWPSALLVPKYPSSCRFPPELVVPKDTWYLMIPLIEVSADTCRRPVFGNPFHRYSLDHDRPRPPESGYGVLLHSENGTGSIACSPGPERPGARAINRMMTTNNAGAHTPTVTRSSHPNGTGEILACWITTAREQSWPTGSDPFSYRERVGLMQMRRRAPTAPRSRRITMPTCDHQQMQAYLRIATDQARPVGPVRLWATRTTTARKQR
jgi:hypothetical protein